MPVKTGGRGEHIASVRRIDATEKQRQAVMLRRAGVSYEAIAEKLGYKSPSGAHKAVMSALQKTLKEPAEELRTMELQRLDMAMTPLVPMVQKGDFKAIDRWLAISAQRCKLEGLYPATEVKILEVAETMASNQLNLFFEMLAADSEIPKELIHRMITIASQLQERSAVAQEN